MTDVHSKEIRSYNMSKIKGKDTKPEILVRKFLFAEGFRYRLHSKKLPGTPDIVLNKYKTVVFIHGCFWHGHNNCKYYVIPKTKTEWWLEKIEKNKANDKANIVKLEQKGWKVIIVWECGLKLKNRDNTLKKLIEELKK
ncbi:very short patch repair endonuclease [Chryseobacterium indologenes]|uniref:very short patch repair endonuclease n=2 Tax=Chryseobacterium indologenes TaxID=253 RepID=UPI001623F8F9|nr:DNA mismatch endonuclease Vsr [Chryseobacterium indologenes]MBF6645524.1 DNA mismatch endonuclease Vsr [Chryseobacterium indologenes]QQQ70802.1 DNA mismatch endonuclease Vsr [Chryseobacterium indologenes]